MPQGTNQSSGSACTRLDITRTGEPRAVSGPGHARGHKTYEVTTTPVPSGPRGDNWSMIFNEQLSGPLRAEHDRAETITVSCDREKYPNWLWLVDMAILRANEKEDGVARS